MRALPLDTGTAPAPPPVRIANRPARVRVRARFKGDGSTLVVLFDACGGACLQAFSIESPRGVMALWLLPPAGSA